MSKAAWETNRRKYMTAMCEELRALSQIGRTPRAIVMTGEMNEYLLGEPAIGPLSGSQVIEYGGLPIQVSGELRDDTRFVIVAPFVPPKEPTPSPR